MMTYGSKQGEGIYTSWYYKQVLKVSRQYKATELNWIEDSINNFVLKQKA